MQSQSDTPTTDDARWASAAVLRITISQLREWEIDVARHGVTLPKADEEAWEGTELDFRRTVL
ncbi:MULTISPECIES: hypothetical protein [unclassified Roseateles]|uniref:hypothetical protein n=1 Tax=unclassified Roseateles TaxID=2626991 RepID=UPI0006F8DADF|nr:MULTISPECIES: hypothetical protein [unclassified Roseateles]KQW50736.1 hypothetical protein ASC81_23830 [Pelomonas sp. Root405]KRA70904.1 hypothetical protein ASD88_13785 [Pelomonas sp. Root662]